MAPAAARTIEVAQMQFRFRGAADALRLVERRYEAFLCSPGGQTPTSEIAVELRPPPDDPAQRADGHVDVSEAEGAVMLWGTGMRAEVTAGAARAVISASGPGPIDVLLRYLLATHLAARHGLLVHASAVERAGGAWLFPGPSGAGKTTIATHLSGRVVCDEAVAVVIVEGAVMVHSTPYWRATPHVAPVAGLVFPSRGSAPSWRELSPARAAARLVSQVGPLSARARPAALETAAAITGVLPSAEVTLASIGDIEGWLGPRL